MNIEKEHQSFSLLLEENLNNLMLMLIDDFGSWLKNSTIFYFSFLCAHSGLTDETLNEYKGFVKRILTMHIRKCQLLPDVKRDLEKLIQKNLNVNWYEKDNVLNISVDLHNIECISSSSNILH